MSIRPCLRQTLAARVRAYGERGLAGIAPNARGSHDEKPGEDLLAASRASGPIRTRAPGFQKLLEGYPAGKGAGFAPPLDRFPGGRDAHPRALARLRHARRRELGDGAAPVLGERPAERSREVLDP